MEEFCSLILSHGRYIQWNSFSLALGNMALLIVQHLRKVVPRRSSTAHNFRCIYWLCDCMWDCPDFIEPSYCKA